METVATKDLKLSTQDSASTARGRECRRCDCAGQVLGGRAQEWVCANHPDWAGRLTLVASADAGAEDVAPRCHRFRVRHEPERVAEAVMSDKVRHIALTDGLFVIVDAADYEWLSRYNWRGTLSNSGYACCAMHGKTVFMHRFIMNPPPGKVVDHINGNRWDNRRGNLRICKRSENIRNTRKSRGTSKFKGVFWDTRCRKWIAAIHHVGRRIHLGVFDDEAEAAHAYDRMARKLFGEYARLNFPDVGNIVRLEGHIRVHSHATAKLTVTHRCARVAKSEIRNPKYETSSNLQSTRLETGLRPTSMFRLSRPEAEGPSGEIRRRIRVMTLAEPDASATLRFARHDNTARQDTRRWTKGVRRVSRGPPGSGNRALNAAA